MPSLKMNIEKLKIMKITTIWSLRRCGILNFWSKGLRTLLILMRLVRNCLISRPRTSDLWRSSFRQKPQKVTSSHLNIYSRQVDPDTSNFSPELRLKSKIKKMKKFDKNSKYLFSNYIGLLNKKKNIMLSTVESTIESYKSELHRTRFSVTLKSNHFDELHTNRKSITFYFKKVGV